ncbi:MAG TPA: hypothetical protein VE690_02695 [Rhodopila sp.]|nr:hypothetical protein [Rhodopila sp.]
MRAHVPAAAFLAAAFLAAAGGTALADESVAGNWHADMGDGVVINMNVTPDGSWSSETSQNKSVVRQMKGTYTQKKTNDTSGVLVFKPTQAKAKSGKVVTETDQYELSGDQLKLTSGGDTMVFDKQASR